MKALLSAIMTEIVGSAFTTAIGGRLYLAEAPQDPTFPYAVYNIISESPDEYFVLSPALEEVSVSFTIYSEDESAVEANDLFENLKTVFDNCVLTVTGYTHIHMWRTYSNLLRFPEANIWQYTADYDVMVAK